MGSLPRELWLSVRDALVAGTTFVELVHNTRGFAAADRADALRLWVQQQPAGGQLVPFEGTVEELEVILDYMKVLSSCGVVLTCRISEDGVPEWMLKRETAVRLAQYVEWSKTEEGPCGFFVLLMVGEPEWGTWQRPIVARLSRAALRIAVEKILPWVKDVRVLPRDALYRRVCARLEAVYVELLDDVGFAWFEMGRTMFIAVRDGAFAQGVFCDCSVEVTCTVCRDVPEGRRVLNNVLYGFDARSSAWL